MMGMQGRGGSRPRRGWRGGRGCFNSHGGITKGRAAFAVGCRTRKGFTARGNWVQEKGRAESAIDPRTGRGEMRWEGRRMSWVTGAAYRLGRWAVRRTVRDRGRGWMGRRVRASTRFRGEGRESGRGSCSHGRITQCRAMGRTMV